MGRRADDKEIYTIVHELNNIMAGLVGYADFLCEDTDEGSEQRRFAKSIYQGGIAAQGLIARIMAQVHPPDDTHRP